MDNNDRMNPRQPNKNNIQLVTEFMDFGKQGALNQAFVLEALRLYAESLVETKDDFIAHNQHQFISPEAWIACAEEWLAAVDKRDKQS